LDLFSLLSPAGWLTVHAAVTWAMVGVIWVVQVVHYPLMAQVGRDSFRSYHDRHIFWVTWVVGPLIGMEVLTGLILWALPNVLVAPREAILGLGLLVIILVSTTFQQVPLHGKLANSWDEEVLQKLVRTNWVRTVVWTLRGGLVIWWIGRAL
jgi:hypothetical protein